MKKRVIVILFSLISTITYSQIKVVETTKTEFIGKVGPKSSPFVLCEKQGNKYIFSYQDAKFQHITDYKSFSFEDVDDAFDNLYGVIMNGFVNPPKEPITIELPNSIIYLSFIKAMGVVNMTIGHGLKGSNVVGVSSYITKKKAMKLFGKYNK